MKTWTVIGRIAGHENMLLYVEAHVASAAARRFKQIAWSGTNKEVPFRHTDFYIEAVFEGRQEVLAGDLAWTYYI